MVIGLGRDGWWSPPVAHRAPQGACEDLVVDRWLDDACPFTSDTGADRGHHWTVSMERTSGLVPLPRRGEWSLVSFESLQAMATRTASRAAGSPEHGPALLPAWTWWLWSLDLVHLAVADALGVLEYSTGYVEGGLPRPLGEPAPRPIYRPSPMISGVEQ